MKETTGWLTNSDELARVLMQLCPGKHGDELMDDVLSAVGLERNQEVSLEDVYALEETGNEAESENISENGSDDDDTEKKVKRRRVIKRPVEQVLRESGRPQMESALRRLHVNLGHCSTNELVRILKHSGATEAAITLARQFSCDVCRENTRPTSARPASPTEVTIFNERLGVDQFEIPGLRHLEKRKMLNIVDHGSGFQMVIPLKSDWASDRHTWQAGSAGPGHQNRSYSTQPNKISARTSRIRLSWRERNSYRLRVRASGKMARQRSTEASGGGSS